MVEIIPNGCRTLNPYEEETWWYTKEGEKIVSKDILEKIKLLAVTEESKKTILEQYYGAIISTLDSAPCLFDDGSMEILKNIAK